MIPCWRIDSISSSRTSRAKSFRGCNVLGTILVSSIWCTLSAASDPSLGVATAGVPMSAPRPLPKPDRAIRSEATGTESQRKQQSAGSIRIAPCSEPQEFGLSWDGALWGLVSEKQLKKVLTLSTEIVYHGG